MFAESMKRWIESKRRAVWFKIGIDKCDWVPVLAKVTLLAPPPQKIKFEILERF